jgi:pyroglutamyl-peptidase
MKTVLVTAFEPYDRWKTNSSWLALVHLTQELPGDPKIVTRRYPVDFSTVKQRLADDLAANYDYALHLGQAPGSGRIQLEAIGLNIGGSGGQTADQFRPLVDGGPVAYHSPLPLDEWTVKLNRAGIPATLSYHAGTYLCNAILYLSCYFAEQMRLKTQAAFIHLPLDLTQTTGLPQDFASLPAATSSAAVRMVLAELAGAGQPSKAEL